VAFCTVANHFLVNEVKRDLVRHLSQMPLTARSSKTLKQSLLLKTMKKEFRLKC
jgi:hypothetical protein